MIGKVTVVWTPQTPRQEAPSLLQTALGLLFLAFEFGARASSFGGDAAMNGSTVKCHIMPTLSNTDNISVVLLSTARTSREWP